MNPTRAACMTPPGVGGIAVIQVVGDAAPTLLGPHLRKAGHPIGLANMPPTELRLCRIVDGEEVLDDAVVSARKSTGDAYVVDLNLHGGPRVVQRVLLMLQRAGIQIVEPSSLPTELWADRNAIYRDAIRLLPRAQTRRVAIWMTRLPELLTARLQQVAGLLQDNHPEKARLRLSEMLSAASSVRFLIDGARVVLIGAPNSGKSTLANALAEREHAVVSQTPGTTRDWTEHPAAVEGIPLTIVDTAGLRATTDPIEREAIRRAIQQCRRADVILQVVDRSAPPEPIEPKEWESANTSRALLVFNKCDLPAHPDVAACNGAEPERRPPVCISAATGDGLDVLRCRLLETLGIDAGGEWPVAPFTPAQVETLRQVYDAVESRPDDRTFAIEQVQNLLSVPALDGSSSDSLV